MRSQLTTGTCIKAVLLLALVMAFALPASAQGCALCYTQAAGAGARMIQALRSGILILIFPPMGICIGLTIMSYRKRNTFREQPTEESQSDLGW